MRSFFELLPFRFEQFLVGATYRAKRTAYRRLTVPSSKSCLPGRRNLFIDMAVISKHDAGTGIQRVVREIASSIKKLNLDDWDVHFVSATRKRSYRQIAWPDTALSLPPVEMKARAGDVFLGLDYSLDSIRRHRQQLRAFKKAGGGIWFMVHDLLPLQRPDWFSSATSVRYKVWLAILSEIADGFFCNSVQTETDLKATLAARFNLLDGFKTEVIPMGDFATIDIVEDASGLKCRTRDLGRFSLMVGTLEPRKGHACIIAGFDRIWQKGIDEKLVIVGRAGWHVDELQKRIRSHPEFQKKLFWFDDVEDNELSQIYNGCVGVIIASHGEGFGLPLIEALHRSKPVLARDLPIFRSHEQSGVEYFPLDASDLVIGKVILQWIEAVSQGKVKVSKPEGTWRDSATIMLHSMGLTRACRDSSGISDGSRL